MDIRYTASEKGRLNFTVAVVTVQRFAYMYVSFH